MRIPTLRSVLRAGTLAALVSGVPSLTWLLVTGGDLSAPINAVAAMVGATDAPVTLRLAAATAVHFAVSLLWAAILVLSIPRRRPIVGSIAAGIAIAFLDLRVIAPRFFPEAAALSFPLQLADHVVWGLIVGIVIRRSTNPSD